jgi:hypothetical protein
VTNNSRGLVVKLAVAEIGVAVEEAVEEADPTRTTLLVDPSTKAAHTLLQQCLHKGLVLKALSPTYDLFYTLSHCLALLVLVNVALVVANRVLCRF